MKFENKRQASEASGETAYTCPMHPEVVSAEPGKCPKCGMFLVEKTDADSGEHKHETSAETSGCCGGHKHEASDKTSGCCGGHKHEASDETSGCCGGHKDNSPTPEARA